MIKDLFNSMIFTNLEQQLINYIKNNPECILRYNAKELSQQCFISSPTIIRFVKKLGFKGYNDFQVQYTQEMTLEKRIKSLSINEVFPLDDVIDILPSIYEQIYLETKQMINKDTFNRVINYLMQAKQIDFYANDNNFSEIQSAALKLNTLGFRAQAFNALNETYVNKSDPKDTLSFVVSHTGRNAAMSDIAYALRKKRFRVVAITGKSNPTLEIICNEALYTCSYDDYRQIMPYSISMRYLLDTLILTLSYKIGNLK